MTMPAKQKIRYSLILMGIALLVTIPDVLFDLSLNMADTLIDFSLDSIHTVIESIEYVLDDVIEATFHTNLQKTQLIVFYIMLLMGIAVSYGMLKLLLKLSARFYRYCKSALFDLWIEERTLFSLYWLNLSLANKIKVIAVIAGLAYLFFMVSF